MTAHPLVSLDLGAAVGTAARLIIGPGGAEFRLPAVLGKRCPAPTFLLNP